MIFFLFRFLALYCMYVLYVWRLFASLPSRPPGAKINGKRNLLIQGRMQIFEKNVFLVHFKPWDLSRKMRREILTEFSSGIIDFENKNISIVQKQWKFRISVPMSYIAFWDHDVMRRDRYIFE